MRFMEIGQFDSHIEIYDFNHLIRSRLGQSIVIWPKQAFALAGYMCSPNNAEAREEWVRILNKWRQDSKVIPRRLRWIETAWARVADILNHHYDLTVGGHQMHRGGPSIGKAIELVADLSKAKGTSKANLWAAWANYKNVAHLITAAIIITADARERAKIKPFHECGLTVDQLHPVLIAMLLPEFVLSVGLFLQDYGLEAVPHACDEPMFDSKTLLRIPSNLNITAIAPPVRKINQEGIAILNARRAGNRGKSGNTSLPCWARPQASNLPSHG